MLEPSKFIYTKQQLCEILESTLLLFDGENAGRIMLEYKLNPKNILIGQELLFWINQRVIR